VVLALRVLAPVLLLVLIAVVWQSWLLQGSLDRQSNLVTLALTERDRLLQMVNEETGVRGYVATGDLRFLQIYKDSLPQEKADAAKIGSLVHSVPPFQSDAARMQAEINRVQAYFSAQIALVDAGRVAEARANLEHGKELFDNLRRAVAAAEADATASVAAQRKHTKFIAAAGLYGRTRSMRDAHRS